MRFLFIIFIFLFCACNNTTDTKHPHKNITDTSINNSTADTMVKVDLNTSKKTGTDDASLYNLHPNGSKDITVFEDTAINDLPFGNCDSVIKLFGKDYELLPDIEDFPRLEVVNKNRTQLLTLFMHNGSTKCSFDEYQVEYLKPNYKFEQKPNTFNTSSFITSKRNKIGHGAEGYQV